MEHLLDLFGLSLTALNLQVANYSKVWTVHPAPTLQFVSFEAETFSALCYSPAASSVATGSQGPTTTPGIHVPVQTE